MTPTVAIVKIVNNITCKSDREQFFSSILIKNKYIMLIKSLLVNVIHPLQILQNQSSLIFTKITFTEGDDRLFMKSVMNMKPYTLQTLNFI